VSWHHVILVLVALALLFPGSRRALIETVRAVATPIIAVLFFMAMRVR
jgi:hypothetical protein